MTSLGSGCGMSWTSPALTYLTSEESYLPITKNQSDWIASLFPLGLIIGYLINPFLVNKIGGKRNLLVFGLTQFLSWLLIYLAKSIFIIYLARVVKGIGYGGGICSSTVYISEIGDKKSRGIFVVIMKCAISIGSWIIMILGAALSYQNMNLVLLMIPLLFMILFSFMPDSKYFHEINQKKEQEEEEKEMMMMKLNTLRNEEERGELKLKEVKKFEISSFEDKQLESSFKTKGDKFAICNSGTKNFGTNSLSINNLQINNSIDNYRNKSYNTNNSETYSSGTINSGPKSGGTNNFETTIIGTKNSETNNISTNHFETKNIGTNNSGTNSCDKTNSGTSSCATTISQTDNCGKTNSGTKSCGTNNYNTKNSETYNSSCDSNNSGANNCSINNSGINNSETNSCRINNSTTKIFDTNNSRTNNCDSSNSGTNNYGINNSEINTCGTKNQCGINKNSSGTNDYDTKNSGTNDFGTNNAETNNCGKINSGTNSCGTNNSEISGSGTNNSGTNRDATTNFVTSNSDTKHDEVPKSEPKHIETFISTKIQDNNCETSKLLEGNFETKSIEKILKDETNTRTYKSRFFKTLNLKETNFWKLFALPNSRRALTIIISLNCIVAFSGYIALVTFTEQIFTYEGSLLKPKIAAVVLKSVSVVTSLLGTLVIERIKRTTLLLISGMTLAISCGFVGMFFLLNENKMDVSLINWMPLFGLIVFDTAFTIGVGSLFYIYQGELLPIEVKSEGITIVKIIYMTSTFFLVLNFQTLIASLGTTLTFFIFAFGAGLSTYITFIITPETKGKSFKEIQILLMPSPGNTKKLKN